MGHYFWIFILLFGLAGMSTLAKAQPYLPETPKDTAAMVRIGNVSVEGNYRTRTTIILREMALRPGDEVQRNTLEDKLEIDRRKIVNTNLFITVEMMSFPDILDSSAVNIRVVVKERWYFITVPVFQLADRNFNEWWYDRDRDLNRITYGLYMSYRNLTGRADRLSIIAEFGFIPKYEILYSLPYFDKAMKTGITTGISYITNKTLPFRTWNDKLDYFNSENLNRERFYTYVNLTRRNKFYSFHSLDFRWNYLQLSDTLARLNPNYLLRSRTVQQYFQLTYSYNHDRRDNVQYPLQGYRYGFQVSKLGLLPTDNTNQAYVYSWYHKYIPVGERWFFNSGIKARVSAPLRRPYAQTVGLGYRADLVRGYELYVIDGQHYFLWGNEFKYKLFSFQKTIPWIPVSQFNTIPLTAYLNTFADLGMVRNYYPELSNSNLSNRLLAGAGVGLDLVTYYNMVFRLNYTINGLGQDRFFFQIGRVL
jgi:outer membrane protein assembly factor BamA